MARASNPTSRHSIRARAASLGSLSFAGLGLSLGLVIGCDEQPVDNQAPKKEQAPEDDQAPEDVPACTFDAEVLVAHAEYVREPGNPWKHETIVVEEGDHVLEFQLEKMPAAEAILDGVKLNLSAGVSVKDVVVHRVELHLAAGTHQLSIRVAGPPGGKVSYTLARAIVAEQPAIIDQFTVHQGESSTHTLCGGLSSIAFGGDALQPADQSLAVTVRCEAGCIEEGASLASPRLVFDTPQNGYQFRTSPVLDHPTTGASVRELDGAPIAAEAVGSVVIDGVEARVLRSRIPHFSAVEDRDLTQWCEQSLKQLDALESYLCYSSGNEPGMQYLALCKSENGVVTASDVTACGAGPDACLEGVDANDFCDPKAVDCEERARAALKIDPCPPLSDDAIGTPSHGLRCDEHTNQVLVGVANAETGECELRGQALLTRDQQVKTVLAATYGARYMEGIEWYMATNAKCAMRDFASEFVDYPAWENTWSTNILKFAICVDILRGRGEPGNLVIAPQEQVLEAEMAAMLVRAGGVGPLGLPDDTDLEPHPRVVDLYLRHDALLNDMAPPLVDLTDQGCPAEAWFFLDPVVQAVVDEGVVCSIEALDSMSRAETAAWLYNLILGGSPCDQASVSCQEASKYPGKLPCETCNSVESCQTLMDSITSMFPDYSVRDKEITFAVWNESYCMRNGDTISCPAGMVSNGKVTNKLLFHELNHALRESAIAMGEGAYGVCSGGSCTSGEFQASLLEGVYFPGLESACLGGHYDFTDVNETSRNVDELEALIHQPPAIPEDVLWSYAMGREDTLVPYLERFGVGSTADIYHSQTYKW